MKSLRQIFSKSDTKLILKTQVWEYKLCFNMTRFEPANFLLESYCALTSESAGAHWSYYFYGPFATILVNDSALVLQTICRSHS